MYKASSIQNYRQLVYSNPLVDYKDANATIGSISAVDARRIRNFPSRSLVRVWDSGITKLNLG